jgi:hypothetical protein
MLNLGAGYGNWIDSSSSNSTSQDNHTGTVCIADWLRPRDRLTAVHKRKKRMPSSGMLRREALVRTDVS